MELKAILFDLDGTLIKFLLDYQKAKRKALEIFKNFDLKGVKLDENASIYMLLKKVEPVLDFSTFNSLKKMVYQFFEEVEIEAAEKITPDPSIKKLIKTLRDMNLKLGLVTNNGRVGVTKSLEKMELVNEFDVIITRDDSNELKPDKGGIMKALELLNVKPNEALFVGDGTMDIIAAKSAGVISVAVPTGPFSVDKLLELAPDYLMDSVHSLPNLIQYLMKNNH